MTRDNAVVYLASDMSACSLWRLWMPHYNFPGSSFYCFRDKPNFDVIAGQDICVVQRLCTQPQWEFVQVTKKLGLKIIYDLDDDMWEISEKNPAYRMLMNFKQGFIECMKVADAISVSTKHLAKVVTKQLDRQKNKVPVFVVENKVDKKIFGPVGPRKTPLIVGWAGSSSHIGDLEIAMDAIKVCAEEHSEVTFEFRGLEPPVLLQTLPNVTFKLWTPVSEFVSRMPRWGWSIALAPLEDHVFNSSKSCIKILESAYCKIPTLCSWLDQYDRFCSYDPELRWLLCANKSNWAPKLRELLNDEARRVDLGERAYKVMAQHFSYDNGHTGWQKVFDYVRGTQPSPVG